jgi:hypothetical protein
MVLSHRNALIFQRNFFLLTVKARLAIRQKFFAYDFKGKFARFGFCAVSRTIENDWSISSKPQANTISRRPQKKTVTAYRPRRARCHDRCA